MSKLHVYTSAACNYIPKVRLLFESVRRYHPEAVLHLLLADELPANTDLSSEPIDVVVQAKELQIADFEGWAFCHTIVELCTAVKPFYLQQLLSDPECAKVFYLDPDTVLFSRLDDICEALDDCNIVLTPHQTYPEDCVSGIIDNELSSLKHGVYNLGFLGVAATDESRRFADYWAQRCYYFCRSEPHNGMFTDQRWIDLVPAMFDGIRISRKSRHNLAPWNLSQRALKIDASGNYWVDDEPLGFYHFTGFDSGAHRIATSKITLKNPEVARLISEYSKQIAVIQKEDLCKTPWRYGYFQTNHPITPSHRLLYRQSPKLQRDFPKPYTGTNGIQLRDWFEHTATAQFPELFDPNRSTQARLERSLNLGILFDPHQRVERDTLLRQIVKTTFVSPSMGLEIIKRGINVLRVEGLKGLNRRVSGRKFF